MTVRQLLMVGALAGTFGFFGQAAAPLAESVPQVPLPRGAVGSEALLKIDDADPAAAKAVGLESLEVAAVLDGPLAQTTVTMTFRNTLKRQLEGELEFPLPEGASVVGYALDVPAGSGNLVEGVTVEKEVARRIFETEERRKVDPGILEMTRGNNYRTRVHPLPAGGTRTVQITYVSDIPTSGAEATYKLPLDFAGNLKAAKIHVEVLGGAKPQDVHVAGLNALAFVAQEGKLVAEKEFGNIALSGTLTVTQRAGDDVHVSVESRPRRVTADALNARLAEDNYFLVSMPMNVAMNAEVARPKTVAVVWDTNLSRAGTDKSAEVAALRALLKQLGNVQVRLLTTTDPQAREFGVTGGKADALFQAIDALSYDGALRIDQMIFGGANDNRSDSQPRTVRADVVLFVSNGLVTLGENHFKGFSGSHATVYTMSGDPQADHALLTRLAEETGGLYLNLQRMKPEQAAETILEPRLVASLVWEQNKPVIDEVYPRGAVPVMQGERVNFAGRLLAPVATANLVYGIAGGTMQSKEVKLVRGAAGHGIVPRFWAQQKAAFLGTDEENADQLLALAKDFNLVTAKTSLLVLETADQYVRYRVVPPKSRPEIYEEFAKRIEEEGKATAKVNEEKIDHILDLWKGRVDWWNTKFTPPTKEQVAAVQAIGTTGAAAGWARAPGGGGGGLGGVSAQPAATPPPTAAAAQPTSPGMGDGHSADFNRSRTVLSEGGRGDLNAAEVQDMAMLSSNGGDSQSTIAIKPWTPDTPYLRALDAAKPDGAYATFLAQRKDYVSSPSFYLDCANWFLDHNQRDMGVRVLTDIAQLRLESAPLLRIAAYRLLQIKQYDLAIDLFEKAKALRPDEPQSWRDLALAISEEALNRAWPEDEMNMAEYQRKFGDLQHAMELYNHVIMNQWDRFDEIEVVALMEANALWEKIQRSDGYDTVSKQHPITNPLDARLVKNLDCDVRIVMTWDADDTDIDLHVIEPTGQEAFYAYNRTLAGALVSHDFTQGYGPEEYLIHHAVPGVYKIAANYYGSSQQSLQGPVTVQATVITHFGRPDETRQSLTLRLTEQKETVPIGEVVVSANK